MKRSLVLSALAAAVLAMPLAAQERTGPAVSLTPYVGYMMFGDFFEGPLGTGLTTKSAPVYGGQLGVGLTDNLSLVGNVAYGTSEWQVRAPIIGGISLGDAKVLLYDAGLEYKLPVGTTGLTPLVHVGAGAMRLSVDNSLVKTSGTTFAGNAGVGFDYQVSRAVGLKLMATDYIAKADFREATGLPVDGKVAHNFVLSAGVRLGF